MANYSKTYMAQWLQETREAERKKILTMTPVTEALPEPMTEVLVWIDGHRGPSWRNNHHLVAYMDTQGNWWEERHPSDEPLAGVLSWMSLHIPE